MRIRIACAWALMSAASGCGGESAPLVAHDAGAHDAAKPPLPEASVPIDDAGIDASPPPCVSLTNASEVLAQNLDGPNGLSLDSTRVYFAESRIYTAKLESVAKSGGALGALGWGGAAYGMKNDADFVYWVSYVPLPSAPPGTDGALSRVAKADGATTVLSQGKDDAIGEGRWTQLALDDSSLYWLDTGRLSNDYVTGRVMSIAKGGGKSTVIASDQDSLRDIVANASFVWWLAGDGIHQASPSGGTSGMFVPFAGYPKVYPNVGIEAGSLALDDTYLYFTDGHGIQRVPIATAKPEVLYAGDVVSMTTDAACIYFTTKTQIFQMSKAGGTPSPIAVVAGQVWSMAADDSGLYYLDYDKGELRRIAR